ncbi:autotransporter outer membrane beta-barrel domain-containing protein, partial [Escherichia coli]|uniref:autotransporter outer membrane beta-barrel domain-containing protein n=1 Tax=Escherichia coli TaxID=562 RepID=UPI002100E001
AFDGEGVKYLLKEGVSQPEKSSDYSIFTGSTKINNTIVNINSIYYGDIFSNNSIINVNSPNTEFINAFLNNSPLYINNDSDVIAHSFISNETVDINNSSLTLYPNIKVDKENLSTYTAKKWNLTGDRSTFRVGNQTSLNGDISVEKYGDIYIGEESSISGYSSTWSGNLRAPYANISVNNTHWNIIGNSSAEQMYLNKSQLDFDKSNNFSTLTANDFHSRQSAITFRTDMKDSDKIMITNYATGENNKILVNFINKTLLLRPFSIPLINAPKSTDSNLFQAAEQSVGFSNILPIITVKENDNRKEWVMNGFRILMNQHMNKEVASFMKIGYNTFINEVNNLNKRMGELRNINQTNGVWARIMNGSGSSNDGYKDRTMHIQLGVDHKKNINSAEIFSGIMISHTDTKSYGNSYKGETKSFGIGGYISTLHNSGIYFDMMSKYVHHENKYDLQFSSAGKHNFHTYSLYAGAEVGYRYFVNDSLFIEPQAELVFGKVQGQTINWNNNVTNMIMHRGSSHPLVGRTGIVSGKNFRGDNWSTTARIGINYEFDLRNGPEITTKDDFSSYISKGEKDKRIIYNVGVNTKFNNNIRFGIDAERSVGGKYNTDLLINANFRYSF